MSYDVAIFGAAPADGWCEACKVSRHPGVLIINGDEVQCCDDCDVCSDDEAADRLRAAGCRVDMLPDGDEPADRGDPRMVWVLTAGGTFYCLAHEMPMPLPCAECAAQRG